MRCQQQAVLQRAVFENGPSQHSPQIVARRTSGGPKVVLRRKALAYITCGVRLLVFEHVDFPEAGIQVPAGTIEPGEEPAAAALREAFEETGLARLQLVDFLGARRRDMSDVGLPEIHERHFFHLQYDGAAPASWQHDECHASDASGPIRFRLYWTPLPDGVPELIAGHGDLLPMLIDRLTRVGQKIW